MGTKLASEVIADAAGLYNDPDFDRIDQESGGDNTHNWLDFLNFGQSQLVIYRPQAYVKHFSVQLAEGTKQTVPDGSGSEEECIQLIDVIRNMGTGGSTPGNAITIVDMATLNETFPNWHAASANSTVRNYAFDERNPAVFWVTPPQPSSNQGYVEIVCSCVPDDISAPANTITLSDVFYHVLVDYLLYRAYLIDSDSSQIGLQKAIAHWNQFVTGIDRKDLVNKMVSPNVKASQNIQ